jgi:AcrR family transcriptional regulator
VAARQGGSRARGQLSRARILTVAVGLADREGLAAVTMRSVAAELEVEAMSLYHHVRGKEDLLDGMVDTVFAEIDRPEVGGDWREELREHSLSGRDVLTRHGWAVALMDSRSSPGPATLDHHDAFLGCLREAGFSVELAAHAFALLDAHLYGFMIQELALPVSPGDDLGALADSMLAGGAPERWPHLRELAAEQVSKPGYAFGDEFEWGLDLILDGLGKRAHRPD